MPIGSGRGVTGAVTATGAGGASSGGVATSLGNLWTQQGGAAGGNTQATAVAVKRLVECAKRKGWLVELAGLLVKDAKKIELVDKAAGESSTFEDVCMAFDKNTEKATGSRCGP